MLRQFNLAGGTALALYLGHRKSIDIDLFSREDFNYTDTGEYLKNIYSFDLQFFKHRKDRN
jgi:hypothetical protein